MAAKEETVKAAPKSRLGRGLSSLIPMIHDGSEAPEIPESRAAVESRPELSGAPAEGQSSAIPISSIVANPYQPRTVFDRAALSELAASITSHGVLQPILVRPLTAGRYELVSGERRFRAATHAGLTEIPAIVRPMTDEESLVIALIENLQREDLNAVEAARGYRRLLDEFRLTQSKLAEQIGKSQSTIANALRLLKLEPKIQESIISGQITEGHGAAILTLADPAKQVSVWERVVTNHLSVAQTRRAALDAATSDGRARRPTPATVATKDIHWQALEDDMRAALGMKVGILPGRAGRGTLVIEFADAEEVEALLERLQASR